jgi:Asp-tRNA(Asn)/Glu-tRNA(Gln) amidotransferase A subunit family amidase
MDAFTTLQNLKAGKTSARQLVQDAIDKIETTHAQLNAAAEVLKTDAEKQLEHLPDGPLKGLTASMKECYAMKGKTIRSGSKRMKPIVCTEDATVVKKLKSAGAVIVARGNTSEFLLGRETDNLIYGTTNSAVNPTLTSGGSSGGDGSLVGSGCVSFGIGTDIGGSCRYPAAFNGILGFKPASGQIDKSGIFPVAANDFSETMNSPGILSRSVRDARLIYHVISDTQINAVPEAGKFQLFTSSDFRVKVKDESISKALHESITFLKTKAVSSGDLAIPESGALMADWSALMFAGFADKIYEWSVTEDGNKLSYFGELLNRMRKKQTLSDEVFSILLPFTLMKPSKAKLEKVIQHVETLRKQYYSMLGTNGILILPTVGILAPPHKKFMSQINKPGVIEIITPVNFCNVLNLSCITIPLWKFQKDKSSSPPSIQLIASPGSEELLLNTAELLETHVQN